MWALVNIFAQIAGMTTPLSCEAVQALAANYTCLARSQQLPALIALAAQIAANGINPPVPPTLFSGIGAPAFTPPGPTAEYWDVTIPSAPNEWLWAGGVWTMVIG